MAKGVWRLWLLIAICSVTGAWSAAGLGAPGRSGLPPHHAQTTEEWRAQIVPYLIQYGVIGLVTGLVCFARRNVSNHLATLTGWKIAGRAVGGFVLTVVVTFCVSIFQS
jgi:hypothetical protein